MDHGVTTRRQLAKPGAKVALLGACLLLILSACGRSSEDAGTDVAQTTITTLAVQTLPETTTTTVATTTTTERPLEYIIQPGDSLSRVAERFGLSTDDLANFNSISDVNAIQVDQVLRIPPVTVAPAATVAPETTVAETTTTAA